MFSSANCLGMSLKTWKQMGMDACLWFMNSLHDSLYIELNVEGFREIYTVQFVHNKKWIFSVDGWIQSEYTPHVGGEGE